MNESNSDEKFLRHALELARQSIGLASPNPYVGAVIVDAHGAIVGSGTHTYQIVKHAEVLALEQACERARGGTLYINLEPCSHVGRTGPCADAIIAAGIRRVVASMTDPNPLVSGRGFEKLRRAGVEVEVGLLQNEARPLNEAFARYIRSTRPLVTLKSAMTLDGKIAPPPSKAHIGSAHNLPAGFSGTWITGETARAHAHELRHQHDAILVGIGTVLDDNPALTDRSGRPRRRPLLRIVLDSKLRLPLESQLVRSAAQSGNGNLLVFASSPDSDRKAKLENRGVCVEMLPSTADGGLEFAAILRRLRELEITSVMIEGGSRVNAAALGSGLVDKVFFYYAPRILGESDAIPLVAEEAKARVSAIMQVRSVSLHRFGEDFAIEGYLRDPYAD